MKQPNYDKINELIDEIMDMSEAWNAYRKKHVSPPSVIRRAILWQVDEIKKLTEQVNNNEQ